MSVNSLRRSSVKSINDVSLPPNIVKGQSIEYLQTLDKQDAGTFYEFFQELNLPDVKEARKDCQRQQELNRELAVKNSEREPEFTGLKEELKRLVTQAEELKSSYQQDYQELKQFQSQTELSSLRKQLLEGTKHSENSSEDYAMQFVTGKTSLTPEDFIEGLLAKRSEYWRRKVMLDKFDELEKNRRPVAAPRSTPSKATPPASSLPASSPAPQPEPTASLPPYPTSQAPGPFPAAGYPGYRAHYPQQPYPPTQPPVYSRAPAGPAVYSRAPAGPTTYRQPGYRAPPPRPQAYGGSYMNQHRY